MQDNLDLVLFDTEIAHDNLLPLSFTRPIADFRVGILTIREKWEKLTAYPVRVMPVEYLRRRFCGSLSSEGEHLFVSGTVVPVKEFAAEVLGLKRGEALKSDGRLLAFRGTLEDLEGGVFPVEREPSVVPKVLRFVFDVFLCNAEAIENDYLLLTSGRCSRPLSENNTVLGDAGDSSKIFIEEGAEIEGAILNVKDGPIYIGRDAVVMEGACLRGPLAICRNAKVKMGACVYPGTTLGPYCKVGGELDNAVLFGYSNKAHEGYLGNAVIGEWCNIGAGTNASNLKNDYSKIRIWNYATKSFMRTDLQFCGLIMGDHSKAGINCMFNTATVIGVGVNVHGSGFPRVFIPSFSEGSASAGFSDVPIKKFYDIASRVMSRRGLELSDEDREVFSRVYEVASGLKAR